MKLTDEELDKVAGGSDGGIEAGDGDGGDDGFVGNTGDSRLREVYEQSQNKKTGMT